LINCSEEDEEVRSIFPRYVEKSEPGAREISESRKVVLDGAVVRRAGSFRSTRDDIKKRRITAMTIQRADETFPALPGGDGSSRRIRAYIDDTRAAPSRSL
jgi:hypothetical protein